MADNFKFYFKQNMQALGLSAPDELFGTLEKSIGSAYAISKAIETYGTRITIGELIGAGTFSEGLGMVLSVGAAFYLGAVIGSIAVATGRSVAGGTTIADVLFTAKEYNLYRNWMPGVFADGLLVMP